MRLTPLVSSAAAVLLVVLAVWLALDVPGAATDEDPADAAGQRVSPAAATITVDPGDGARAIGDKLAAAGVIDSPRRFETLVALFGYEANLAAGDYDFEAGLTTTEIIERIRAGITAPLVVTIPEGLRIEEIAERLDDEGILPAVDFLIATRIPANWEGTSAAGRPAGVSIEGYLFPSTYRFSARATGDAVVRAMLERFDDQISPEIEAAIRASGRTLHDVLTIASIVEREAALAGERATIASVFWNRVRDVIALQADPTVQYAIAAEPANVLAFGYWKPVLEAADLTYSSLFNTYVVIGLPPTPIAAPGLASILAAVEPATTEFLYFVSRGDGSHVFAATFGEHLENVVRFQGEE
jgi:UPF0755 protein